MKLNFRLRPVLLALVFFSVGMGFGYRYLNKSNTSQNINYVKNSPQAFLSEAYDTIKQNYWDNISDATLINLFENASSALGNPIGENITSKNELIRQLNPAQAPQLLSQVLASLSPIGRSALYTQKQENNLKDKVANINPQNNLYKDLGLSNRATSQQVNQAYAQQAIQLEKESSPEAQAKLKELTYAKNVLSNSDTKQRYDNGGVEPTIFTKVLGQTLYLQFKKFSPTSLDEFQKAFDKYKDDNSLDSLVLDLRGNIGGAIDETSYFLGFFLGKNQYAFDFYHKGEYLPFKTPTDKLPTLLKYKQIVMLVDNQTQSSAEMMAASFKRYNLGVVLGTTTRGWGTVEKVFPLENQISKSEKYSVFLVHSLTLRDDNLPVEGRGVDPDIKLTDPNWQQELFEYFRNPALADAIKSIL